ncbi:MAG: peptide deformylase [Candidatus Binatia bacterium]|nr:MAG: peptide deformylase [Candidatus Binatia bacterium]
MALRPILKYPDPTLKRVSTPVGNIDGRVHQLLDDMVETMYHAPGIGLAAPQVGVSERVIVVDVDKEQKGIGLVKLINPEIRAREGSIVFEEGCLSVIGYTAEVRRSAKILVHAWTPEEREIELEAEGLFAVCLQHEMDHLDGKLFLDRISSLKRDLYRRRLKKWMREGFPEEVLQASSGL